MNVAGLTMTDDRENEVFDKPFELEDEVNFDQKIAHPGQASRQRRYQIRREIEEAAERSHCNELFGDLDDYEPGQRHVKAAAIPAFFSLTSIFVALSILLAGHGLQQTILPMTGNNMGWPAAVVSLLGAGYFCGFIVGCYRIPRWIRRVGHARVFSACGGLAAIAVLSFDFTANATVWIALRAVTGFSFAGLYMVIESWLNSATTNDRRGSVMSLYSLVSLFALSAGQFLTGLDLATGTVIAAMAFCLAIYPVALTGVTQPDVPEDVRLSYQVTYRASQVAPIASAVSGFVMGLSWSVGAVFATETLGSPSAGSDFITLFLLGGMCSLIPLGRLSDRIDRRLVLLGISLIGCATGLYAWIDQPTYNTLMITAFVIGATAMPLYSLAIAHANDNASTDFLVVGGTLLVANGVGAVVAPLLYAGLTATLWDHDIFFLFVGLGFLLNTAWTAYRLTVHTVKRKYFEPYQAIPRTTLGAVELDPRAEHDDKLQCFGKMESMRGMVPARIRRRHQPEVKDLSEPGS